MNFTPFIQQNISIGLRHCRVHLAEASAALLEQLWRGHWTIESGSHCVRGVTLGEDRHHMYTATALQVLSVTGTTCWPCGDGPGGRTSPMLFALRPSPLALHWRLLDTMVDNDRALIVVQIP
jgi:hypothetical protein